MAGPLNFDNYSIEADESSDELVITHAPTGKTTTLSEDTFESVDTEELNTDRVYDSSGRYLGSLTGAGDSQVLIDAFNDRQSGTGVILPDPGFALGWDKEVDLPNEESFQLTTLGTPTLSVNSGYSGSHAIRKPPTGGSAIENISVGAFEVSDDADALDYALQVNDTQHSTFYPIYVRGAGGVEVSGPNAATQNNVFVHPSSISEDNSPYYHTTPSAPGNIFIRPLFKDFDPKSATGILDEADHNTWYNVFARSLNPAVFDSARNYKISFGFLDETGSVEATVKERNGAKGSIDRLPNVRGWAKVRAINPLTHIDSPPRTDRGGDSPTGGADWLSDLLKVTPAHALSSLGLADASSGGTISLFNSNSARPLTFDTGAAAIGDTAVLNQGGNSIEIQNMAPKLFLKLNARAAGDVSDVLVRAGFRGYSGDYAELIYDPNDVTAAHGIDNWFLEVFTDGTVRGRTDLGVAPSESATSSIALSRTDTISDALWYANVRGNSGIQTTDGVAIAGSGQFRVEVQTRTTSDAKEWDLLTADGYPKLQTV